MTTGRINRVENTEIVGGIADNALLQNVGGAMIPWTKALVDDVAVLKRAAPKKLEELPPEVDRVVDSLSAPMGTTGHVASAQRL